MGSRIVSLLFFFLISFPQLKAQTVGAYGSTFMGNWSDVAIRREYLLGPGAGLFMNGFLKGKFNPGIDIQYTKIQNTLTNSYVEAGDTFYMSDVKYYNAITDIKLDLEFTSPQEDTIVICFGLQPGIAYLQDHLIFRNPNVANQQLNNWVPSFGGSGTLRRNYIFGTPLQLFLSLSAQGYMIKPYDRSINKKTVAFQGQSSFVVGYIKLGLAYKL
jgi:hypothetical protein